MESTSKVLAPVIEQQSSPELLLNLKPKDFIFCSLDWSDPAMRRKAIRIVTGDRTTSKQASGKRIKVEHIISDLTMLPDGETGELVYGMRLFLIAPDDSFISCTGKPAIDTIKRTLAAEGPPPWQPAQEFDVVLKHKDDGKDVVLLLPVE
jgi:hypothetical protein